jgi:murein DD-endopeptidase MepM/ murein hydrolase activator NlpD
VIADREIERGSSSMLVPAIVGAAAVGGILWWRHRRNDGALDDDFRDDDFRDDDGLPTVAPSAQGTPPPVPPGRWVFPVPRWQGRAPEVSDGWRNPPFDGTTGRTHKGADIMFRRRFRGELADVFPPRSKEQPSGHTSNYFMPPGTLVLAMADAEIWSAGWTPRGYSVVLSHGAPWATYYTHMSRLRVGETRRGASKERVRAGQPLGVVGADPKDARGVAHLHTEIWYGGNRNTAIDPGPYLRRAIIVDNPEVN